MGRRRGGRNDIGEVSKSVSRYWRGRVKVMSSASLLRAHRARRRRKRHRSHKPPTLDSQRTASASDAVTAGSAYHTPTVRLRSKGARLKDLSTRLATPSSRQYFVASPVPGRTRLS